MARGASAGCGRVVCGVGPGCGAGCAGRRDVRLQGGIAWPWGMAWGAPASCGHVAQGPAPGCGAEHSGGMACRDGCTATGHGVGSYRGGGMPTGCGCMAVGGCGAWMCGRRVHGMGSSQGAGSACWLQPRGMHCGPGVWQRVHGPQGGVWHAAAGCFTGSRCGGDAPQH